MAVVVLAGEHVRIPWSTSVGNAARASAEASGPMTASICGFCATSRSWASPTFVALASAPSSAITSFTGMPLYPPAALICETASCIAWIMGIPIAALGPVCGSKTPSSRT